MVLMYSTFWRAFSYIVLMLPVTWAILPSRDPFYLLPSGLESYKLGEKIRSRPISVDSFNPGNASIQWPLSAAFQYLYRTADSLGHATGSVTTILVPINASYPSKLLSYQAAYDSANNDCSPSYTLRTGASDGDTDRAFISAALGQGLFVAIPDYECVTAQYAAGITSGHATLDGVRLAIEHSDIQGLSPLCEVVLWGYSGGGLATEWALELQPRYAPELGSRLVGAALGGLVPNLTDFVVTINDGPDVGLAILGLDGLGKAYPNLTSYIEQHLDPSKSRRFSSIATKCTGPALAAAANMSVYDFFDTHSRILTDPIPASVLEWGGQMGLHGTPRPRLFVYKSVGDQLSPIADTDALMERFCQDGVELDYVRDSVGNHFTEAITGGALAFQWILDRFASDLARTGDCCRVRNVTLNSKNVTATGRLGSEVISFLVRELESEGID